NVIRGSLPLMIGHYSAGGVVFIICPLGTGPVSDSGQPPLRRRAWPTGRPARHSSVTVVEIIHWSRQIGHRRPFGSEPCIDLRRDALELVVDHRRFNSAIVPLLYEIAVLVVGIPHGSALRIGRRNQFGQSVVDKGSRLRSLR